MRSMIYTVILLSGLWLAATAPQAASVYLWTDDNGRLHITDGPPPEGSKLRDTFEYEPRSQPESAVPSSPSEIAEPESRDKEAQCRNVFEAHRNLRKTKSLAAAVRQRAEEARDKVKDLRDRIGFDDDRRDDFKDDLKRLEQSAHQAEMFAEQAALDVQVAELQVKLAETEAGEPCAQARDIY
ncbi:MAG: DUF4124 domain-containing protein [Desulfobacterales bacterium]|jgi:hypothetical protein